LPFRLKAQFLFCQLWYPLFASFMALMFLLPIAALAAGGNFADVTYPRFFLHFTPISMVLVFMGFRWRASGTFRPFDRKVLSWEKMLFRYARWPWVLVGSATAVRDWIRGSAVEFRVTPKGGDPAGPLPTRVLLPYGILSAASSLAVLLF